MKQREIKFRAWDIANKAMIKVDELLNLWSQYSDEDEKANPGIQTIPHVTAVQQGYIKDRHFVVGKDCVLMQYTGLKDKNGREIYEGDIVEADGLLPSAVVFYESAFRTEPAAEPLSYDVDHYGGFTIIGNIYENTELIPQ